MNELDFTIEFNGQGLSERAEVELFAKADSRLRELATGYNDLIGAAVNVRQPARAERPFIFEVTVVVYARPDHIAATEKEADPFIALKSSLNAIERQVRKKREKLREHWQKPGNDPASREIVAVLEAEDSHV